MKGRFSHSHPQAFAPFAAILPTKAEFEATIGGTLSREESEDFDSLKSLAQDLERHLGFFSIKAERSRL